MYMYTYIDIHVYLEARPCAWDMPCQSWHASWSEPCLLLHVACVLSRFILHRARQATKNTHTHTNTRFAPLAHADGGGGICFI